MAETKTIRWGIMATGIIAQSFVKDLLIDPTTRGVHDVKHTVVAAASSSSADRAAKFLEETGCPRTAAAYGSYPELVHNRDVDVVYVATPHSHHFQNTMLCLEAGKHVLCEKAFTVNAAQVKILAETARRKRLFLMEALWTRYFPISIKIRELVSNGDIGSVYRVFADNSFGEDVETKWEKDHRMVNIDLAGGALLDLGIYALTWVFQILYHTLPPAQRKPPQVSALISTYPGTGADESTTMALKFPVGPAGATYAHGIATTNFRVATYPGGDNPVGIRIQGTKGEIQVEPPAYRPKKFRLIKKGGDVKSAEVKEEMFEIPGDGKGLFWEADETARCIRDGKLESETMSLDESIVIMEVMDEVRRQGNLKYPEKIESTEYPIDL